ncbi:Msx2-interacting protein [Amphibalanus amphitrite]|uniref:Msx2-interacting protein n=1 Tax=Amphibalanus amphitrite TaxID=1232801 RepID=A0A6A4WMW8_AMPAM|nr:Msx2-interacting protein [Amphibalanus amphitrite]
MVRETRHLWVGNLPDSVTEDRIKEHFKRYGRVQSVKLLSAEDAAGPAATVAFIDIKSAAKAHNAENRVEERPLLTKYYDPNGRPAADEPARPPAGVGGYPAGRGRGAGFSRGVPRSATGKSEPVAPYPVPRVCRRYECQI